MSESRWSFSPEKEILMYREISDKLSAPINILKWLASVITTGENAETISRYKSSGELEP
jgi:hypothetical protein